MSITDSKKHTRAIRQVQRALRKDPKDIESLLKLAAMLGTSIKPDLDQKRQVLHQILTLEPYNQKARRMLFEMDRNEIGGNSARLSLAVILTDLSRSLPQPPLVLRYSIVQRLLVYLFMGFAVFISLFNLQAAGSFVWFGPLLAFFVLPLWYVSAVIEISDDGLKVSRLFGLLHTETAWRDVRGVKRTVIGQGVRIIDSSGKALEVSAQIQGYPFILDILKQMRPDLFQHAEDSVNPLPTASGIAQLAAKTVTKI